MAILYDTNILLALIRKSNFDFVHQTVNPRKMNIFRMSATLKLNPLLFKINGVSVN
jgi:hypothetical protein